MLVGIVVGFNNEVVMAVYVSYWCFSQPESFSQPENSVEAQYCAYRRSCRAVYIADCILNAPWLLQAMGRFSLLALVKSHSMGLCMTHAP